MAGTTDALPYCGPPPLPAGLAVAWNWDPVLLAALIVCGLLPLLAPAAAEPDRQPNRMAYAAGMAVLAVAFVAPLCALSTALFAARMLHHLLLVALAAPLLVLGLPRLRPTVPLSLALLAHLGTMVVWHAPGPYGWALSHPAPYWIMELSLMAGALAFWQVILRAPDDRPDALLGLLAAVAGMGLLGALITFAPHALYSPHLATTAPWGLTALEDQQLAGLLLWVLGIMPYLGVALAALAKLVLAGSVARGGPAR